MTGIGKRIDVSFEFFPTSTEVGRTNLVGCVEELAPLEPTFFSVTYGAGGSTRDRTHATIASVRDNTDVTVAGHLTCVASSRTEVQAVLDQYRNAGLSRIVALRGDDPADYDPSKIVDGYSDAAALVAGIRQRVDGDLFDLSVGAYPEVHPRAESAQSDLDNLKRKIDAGADRAITQFFFDTDAFLRFHDRARAAGITVPIIPGIMPLTNFGRVAGFAERCGTVVPQWLRDLFGDLDGSPEAHHEVAAAVAIEQCRLLEKHGARQFHFYTMNKPRLSIEVCSALSIEPKTIPAGTAVAS